MFCRLLLDTSPASPRGVWILLGVLAFISEVHAHLPDMGHKESRDGGAGRALTLSQLAARLGVKPQTIYDLRSEGRGPKGFRVGSELRFRKKVVDAWIRHLEDEDEQRHLRGSR